MKTPDKKTNPTKPPVRHAEQRKKKKEEEKYTKARRWDKQYTCPHRKPPQLEHRENIDVTGAQESVSV
jgi:hypothetical protein